MIDDALEDDPEKIIADNIRAAEEISDQLSAPIDLKEAGLSQRDALLSVCDRAQMWQSPEGEAYASVPVGDHVEHYELASRDMRSWMIVELARDFTRNGRPASTTDSTIRDARMSLEARARKEGTRHLAGLRVVQHDDDVYVDLGTPDWSAVKVMNEGWRIVARPPVPVLRGKKAAAFPRPVLPGDFGALRKLLDRLDEDDFILLVAWCLGALSAAGPYPILILGGEQGSGKSTLARLAQRLTDPTTGDLLQPPKDDRDLIAAARKNRVLAFDNISALPSDLADSFCRLATGSEIGGRALFTDHDTATFSACRPMILNGIPDLAGRGDLADRALTLRLGKLNNLITERDWQSLANDALPQAFAALLDALSLGLKRLEEVPTPNTRMADFARLVVAAEPALPWPEGSFLAAYDKNRGEAAAAFIEGDLVASTLRSFMANRPEGWCGYTTELWHMLSDRVQLEAKRRGDWPANGRWFSDRLRRAKPVLRTIGIVCADRRDSQGMLLTLEWIATPATFATEPSSCSPYDFKTDASDVASAANAATDQPPEELKPKLWRARL